MYHAQKWGYCQFISLDLLLYICSNCGWVVGYGLVVSGDTSNDTGWGEANPKTMTDASAEVAREGAVGVSE